jgi:hypothetical protein
VKTGTVILQHLLCPLGLAATLMAWLAVSAYSAQNKVAVKRLMENNWGGGGTGNF